MAVLRVKVLWTDGNGVVHDLQDYTSINIRKATEIQQSSAEITFINQVGVNKAYIRDQRVKFRPEQDIEIYATFDDDNTGLSITNDNLLFSGRVVEYQAHSDADKTPIKVRCADSTYIALNKLWVGDEVGTAPELIKKVIDFANDTIPDEDKKISVEFESNGGFVQDTPVTIGSFPEVRISQVFKPVPEVLQKLSQKAYTGEDLEIAYRFHVDRLNRFHWFYPDDAAQHVLVEGSLVPESASYTHPVTQELLDVDDSRAHVIKSIEMTNAVYDIVNFIIYKAGEDMNNSQILNFAFDATTGNPTTRDSFRNWEDIARGMKKEAADAGEITKVGGDEFEYPSSYGVGLIPRWSRLDDDGNPVIVTSDSEYNEAFIQEANLRAISLTQAEFIQTGSPRFKGTVEITGENVFDPNDALVFTSRRLGIREVFMRVTDINHNINKSGWHTTLQLEEEIPRT